METYNLIINGSTPYCRRTKTTLNFNSEGILLNPQAIARSGQVGWGAWQTSKKIKSKYGHLWNIQTAGHGGFILVTQEEIKHFKPYEELAINHTFYIGASLEVKVYVYQFEEDCNYAIILKDDEIAFNDYCKVYLKDSKNFKSIEEVQQFLKKCINDSLTSMEEYRDRENQKNDILDDGGFLRCSAISMENNKVKVTFKNKENIEKNYLMDDSVYDSIPLMVNATIEDYQQKGSIKELNEV